MKRAITIFGDTASIPLTKGFTAVIDAADVALIDGYSWTADDRGNIIYAKRAVLVGGKYVTIKMHRVILSAGDASLVDHIDGNGLNNRRSNLRLASVSENLRNRGLQKNNKSGVTGVTWNKKAGKWQAQIKIHRETRYLGLFDRIEAAAKARADACARLHGKFAHKASTREAAA